MPDISVVIPVYNNGEVLNELNTLILQNLSVYDLEIIYINDASSDQSIQTLRQLERLYDEVTVIDLPVNHGQQKATLEGLRRARGRKITVMDGDLQDAPVLIPELYTLVKEPNITAYVLRKGSYQSRGRMVTSRLIKYVIYVISGLHYQAGSYYMMDRSIQPVVVSVAMRCKHPYLSIIVAHFSKSLQYVPAKRAKSMGPSGYSFISRIKAASDAIYCSLFCSYVSIFKRGK